MNAEVTEILPATLCLSPLSTLVQVLQHLQVSEQKAVKYHSGIGKEVVKPTDEAKVKAKRFEQFRSLRVLQDTVFLSVRMLKATAREMIKKYKENTK